MRANAPIDTVARFMDRRTPPHILTLVLLAGLGALNMNILLPSLPAMADYFGTDYAIMQLAISAYLAATALLQIITGPLSDRFGRRPVLIASLVIFLAATLMATLATSIEAFLAARLLQAVIVTGFALSRAIVRDMVPMEQAASMIGYVTMGMAVVPMMGPAIGGVLQESFGWQSNFFFTTIAGLAILLIVVFDLSETNHNRTTSMGAQFRAYPELLTSRRFWGFSFSAMFAAGTFFAFLGGAPYVAQYHLRLSPSELGAYFALMALGYMIGNFLSGRYAQLLGVFPMMITGNVVAVAGVVLSLILFGLGMTHPLVFFLPLAGVGLGNGLTLPSANAGMVSVRPHLAGSAAGLGGALMIGGGAALSVLAGLVLDRDSGPEPLLLLMIAASLLGLAAAYYTRHVDRSVANPLRTE